MKRAYDHTEGQGYCFQKEVFFDCLKDGVIETDGKQAHSQEVLLERWSPIKIWKAGSFTRGIPYQSDKSEIRSLQ